MNTVLHLLESNEERVQAENLRTSTWTGSQRVDWWLRTNHLRKLCRDFSAILVETWENSEATNNPVESINRVSKTVHLCSLKEALQHVHSEDRRTALLLTANR